MRGESVRNNGAVIFTKQPICDKKPKYNTDKLGLEAPLQQRSIAATARLGCAMQHGRS
jgi:hypothetical protein